MLFKRRNGDDAGLRHLVGNDDTDERTFFNSFIFHVCVVLKRFSSARHPCGSRESWIYLSLFQPLSQIETRAILRCLLRSCARVPRRACFLIPEFLFVSWFSC